MLSGQLLHGQMQQWQLSSDLKFISYDALQNFRPKVCFPLVDFGVVNLVTGGKQSQHKVLRLQLKFDKKEIICSSNW